MPRRAARICVSPISSECDTQRAHAAAAVRTFGRCYQADGWGQKPFTARDVRQGVDAARLFLVILGLIFAVAGLAVGWTFDRLSGLTLLLIGAFLLILPFITHHTDD